VGPLRGPAAWARCVGPLRGPAACVCYEVGVPRFQPFVGLRYGPDATDISGVVCPPYDVISPHDRELLEAEDPANCVRVELPRPAPPLSAYESAAATLAAWRGQFLAVDDGPSFYVYRMGFKDHTGRPRQTTGVLGALVLEPPGNGILPHERTTPKDKQDRLDLLTATRTNLSPIWGLSLASGLSGLCDPQGPPDAEASVDGVDHQLWRVSQPAITEAISSLVASAPVVVADGHHRYEVALAYQASCSGPGAHDAVLALIVELSEEQLAVAPIHRLLSNLPAGWDPASLFGSWFSVSATDPPDDTILDRMEEAESLALVAPGGTWLLHPNAAVIEAAEMDLDSSRLAIAVGSHPGIEVRFQHGVDAIVAAVASGDADAGVLLRPATVAQIAAVAHEGTRMPPKTTFFTPKPATGMVFRAFADQPNPSDILG
jgi:uncharacterized protein (DUF1015 family)